MNDIHSINQDFYKESQKLLEKKIEESNKLAKYYQNRNVSYTEIKTMIPEQVKNEFILVFKNNKNKVQSLIEINRLAKKHKISANDVEKWFSWIESSYLYLLVKKDINKSEKQIINKENEFDFNARYMIIKKPIIIK